MHFFLVLINAKYVYQFADRDNGILNTCLNLWPTVSGQENGQTPTHFSPTLQNEQKKFTSLKGILYHDHELQNIRDKVPNAEGRKT